eukprot:365034-Chlamydomonas_euryale.AAC.6
MGHSSLQCRSLAHTCMNACMQLNCHACCATHAPLPRPLLPACVHACMRHSCHACCAANAPLPPPPSLACVEQSCHACCTVHAPHPLPLLACMHDEQLPCTLRIRYCLAHPQCAPPHCT